MQVNSSDARPKTWLYISIIFFHKKINEEYADIAEGKP